MKRISACPLRLVQDRGDWNQHDHDQVEIPVRPVAARWSGFWGRFEQQTLWGPVITLLAAEGPGEQARQASSFPLALRLSLLPPPCHPRSQPLVLSEEKAEALGGSVN